MFTDIFHVIMLEATEAIGVEQVTVKGMVTNW